MTAAQQIRAEAFGSWPAAVPQLQCPGSAGDKWISP